MALERPVKAKWWMAGRSVDQYILFAETDSGRTRILDLSACLTTIQVWYIR